MMMLHAIEPEIPERFLLCAAGVAAGGFHRTWRVINGQLHINRRDRNRTPFWEQYSNFHIDRWMRRATGFTATEIAETRRLFI